MLCCISQPGFVPVGIAFVCLKGIQRIVGTLFGTVLSIANVSCGVTAGRLYWIGCSRPQRLRRDLNRSTTSDLGHYVTESGRGSGGVRDSEPTFLTLSLCVGPGGRRYYIIQSVGPGGRRYCRS